MSYHHSSHQPQHSSIKTLTHPVPATQNATPFGHTRILSRFFLPPLSCGATGATGLMQFKITKASTAVRRTERANNKHKTIPHSLYDDPAFSADPSSNPLCSTSHDITSWVIDPPKGHPAIKSPQAHRSSDSNHEITLIQPPNSPALLHAHPQQRPQVRNPAKSPSLDPPPSGLSPGTSSAFESSLQTPGASPSSPIKSRPDIPPMLSSGDNKKRLGLSFLKRKSNVDGAVMNRLKSNRSKSISSGENPKNMEFISHSHSLVNGSGAAMNGTTNGKTPGVVKGQFAPVKTRELDMIDELDESNPLGIALHHGGPYEAIQRVVGPHAYVPRAPRQPNHQPPPVQDQPFRFDVPLNLSPGQVLPHSVTCYYRPRVHLTPASDIRDRLGLYVPPFRDHPTDHFTEQIPLASAPAVNSKAGTVMNHPNIDHSATSLASSQASYPITSAPPPYVALEPPHQHEIPEQIQPVSRVRAPVDPSHTSQRERPSDQVYQSAMEGPGTGETTHEADEGPGGKTRMTEQAVAAERQISPDNQGAVQQSIPNRADYSTLPYLTGADRETMTPPYGSSRRNTPSPHPNHVPSAPHDSYGRQELPQAPVYDRRLYGLKSSAPNSNSSLHSGASSAGSGSTAGTSATSMPTRNRILPKQLIMPAPLAKAALSSRPKPTQMPQSLQQWQDMRGQHRIRFHDGTEYELPVTALTQTTGRERPASMQVLPANTIKPHIRVNSIAHGAKLRKQTSLRGPEPPEIVARLAAAPRVVQRRKYMEPPPTLPDPPRVDRGMTKEQGKDAKRFLTKRKSLL